MKKIVSLVLITALTMTVALGLSSCEDENPEDAATESVTAEGSDTTVADGEDTTAEDTDNSGATTSEETSSSDETEPHTHIYGDWTATKEPTCTEKGSKERVCFCGDKITEEISEKGHSFAWVVDKAATQTETGLKHEKCSCGEKRSENTVIPKQDCNHSMKKTNAVKPTCTKDGNIEHFTCSKCQKIFSDENGNIEITKGETVKNATGHTEVIDKAVAPSCSKTGLTEGKHCSVCNAVLVKQNTVAMKAHTEVIDAAVPATKTEDGLTEGKHCSVCKKVLVKQEVVPAAGASKGLAYKVNSDGTTCTITGIGTCKDTDVVIPSAYNGFPVTSIGDEAFIGCDSLTSVTIPDGVTSIGYSAFDDCTSLTSITIPDSVTSMGSVIGCDSLKYNEYNDGYYLGNDANKYLVFVSPQNTYVGTCTIHESTKVICFDAFEECYSLKSVTIGDNVTSIGDGTFSGLYNLETVTIGDSVKSIGLWAFVGCESLTSIVIPDSVIRIVDGAFEACTSLTSITIPDSVTDMGAAFVGCDSLTNINVNSNNRNYKSIDGNLYNKDATKLITYAPGKVASSFTIPDSVTSIGDHAFSYCTSVESVVIPDSVTDIGYFAFGYCTSLTGIIIPDSVTSIGEYAFSDCSKLTINCEAETKPSGWDYEWNVDNRPVNWGYKG